MYSQYEQRQEKSPRDYEGYNDDDEDAYETLSSTTYRSILSPRITNLHRSRPTGLNAPGISTRLSHTHSSTNTTTHFGPGLASLVHYPAVPLRGGATGVSTATVSINTNREREKRELEDLNDKFARYVEKVRFLEAHNRKLTLEIDALQNRVRQGTSRIKEMFDIEIAEANRLIDDTRRDAAASNAKKQQAERELLDQTARYNRIKNLRENDRREIDALQFQIAENEAQIALFRRRIADLDDEARRYKSEAQRLSSEINRLQNEIQNEVFVKSSCEVEKIVLEDDLTNLRHLHEADLAELRSQSVTNDLDPSQFFRNELSEAIREIRSDYEAAIANRRSDLQNRHSLFVNEMTIRTQQHDANPLFTEQQRRQVESRRNELLQVQNQNDTLRHQNREMQDSIAHFRQRIRELKDGNDPARVRVERDIDEALRHLKEVEQKYADMTVFRTTLEKEIATYRELLESTGGLREYTDRIIQNIEQKTLERPSHTYRYRSDSSKTSTIKTIARTFVNARDSNYGYVEPTPHVTLRTSASPSPPPASTYYQVVSSTSRIIPVQDETARRSSSSDSTIRGDNSRQSIIMQDVHTPNNSNHNSLVRAPTPSSSMSSSSSSSSEAETSAHRNGTNNHPPNAEYETLTDF